MAGSGEVPERVDVAEVGPAASWGEPDPGAGSPEGLGSLLEPVRCGWGAQIAALNSRSYTQTLIQRVQSRSDKHRYNSSGRFESCRPDVVRPYLGDAHNVDPTPP